MNEDKLLAARDHLRTVRNYIVNGEISGAISDACNAIDEALAPPDQDLKCGLTDEEWQVMIDGGYLCSVGDTKNTFDSSNRKGCNLSKLINIKGEDYGFTDAKGIGWAICRPYRAVGHVQPYFDNEECKAYLDGLENDALLIRRTRGGFWCDAHVTMKICREGEGRVSCYHGVDTLAIGWDNVSDFIVLSDGTK
ncbi:MAG: hypothetical protein ABUJ92_00615 [Desulfobacterales bacterium]